MFYSTPDNDSLIAITAKIPIEKRNDILAKWNTVGLKPGPYLLHIFVSDSSSNPVIVEAVRSFTHNPRVLEVENLEISNVKVYPNPVSKTLYIDLPWANSVAILYNDKGIIARKEDVSRGITGINVSDLPGGLYILILSNDVQKVVSRFIKQ